MRVWQEAKNLNKDQILQEMESIRSFYFQNLTRRRKKNSFILPEVNPNSQQPGLELLKWLKNTKNQPNAGAVGGRTWLSDHDHMEKIKELETLVDQFQSKEMLTQKKILYFSNPEIKEVITNYLALKYKEEKSKSKLHKALAAFFSPKNCGKEKIRVAKKILEAIQEERDPNLTNDEKQTAQSNRLGRVFNR